MPTLEEQVKKIRGQRLGVIPPEERTPEEMQRTGTIFGVTPTPMGVFEAMTNLASKFGAENIGRFMAGVNEPSKIPDIWGNVPAQAVETLPKAIAQTPTPPVSQTPKVELPTVQKETIQPNIPKINATPKAAPTAPTRYGVEGGITPTPALKIEGNTFTSINPNRPLGVEALPKEEAKVNPYDVRFNETLQELKDTLNTTPTDMNELVAKKYKVGGLTNMLKEIVPLTSQGHYGVESMKNLVEKGKLGIQQEKLIPEIEEIKAKTGYYQAGVEKALGEAEEARGKGKYYSESAPKAEPYAAQAQKSWLTGWQNYIKSEPVLQDLMDKTPEERDAAIVTHQALYKKLFPPPPIGTIENPDGTVTVRFADGTTQKFKKKEGR